VVGVVGVGGTGTGGIGPGVGGAANTGVGASGTGGGPGVGGAANGGGLGASVGGSAGLGLDGGESADDDAGCGCRSAPVPAHRGLLAVLGILGVGLVARRRRAVRVRAPVVFWSIADRWR
jgi:arabinoxylan arabinofuranohydrolase